MWNRDSPVSIVSLHWWPQRDWSVLWPHVRRASSRTITRPLCWQCDNPTWSHTALLSRFHAHCRSPFRLHNRCSRLLGGALCRACNLTSFSPCLTGPVDYPFASRHKELGFKTPGGDLCEPGILLLALSHYTYNFKQWEKKKLYINASESISKLASQKTYVNFIFFG